MQTRISGGFSETAVNELAVNPNGLPLESATVAIVTPEAKRAQNSRKVAQATGGTVMGVQLDNALNSILS